MLRRGAKRWAAALALGAALASPALASPRATKPVLAEAPSLNHLWDVATGWLALAWHTLAADTTDRGAMMDPNGATTTSEGDRGIMIDPDGATTTSDGDRGWGMDPNG